jgi:hypothetical protein
VYCKKLERRLPRYGRTVEKLASPASSDAPMALRGLPRR